MIITDQKSAYVMPTEMLRSVKKLTDLIITLLWVKKKITKLRFWAHRLFVEWASGQGISQSGKVKMTILWIIDSCIFRSIIHQAIILLMPNMWDKDLCILRLKPCLKSKFSEKEFWLVLMTAHINLWIHWACKCPHYIEIIGSSKPQNQMSYMYLTKS